MSGEHNNEAVTTHAAGEGVAAPLDAVEAADAALRAVGLPSGVSPSLAEQVSRVPTDPGCYLWKDASDTVVYVGKAKNLRARMRQYVTLQDERQKIPLMMQLVKSFDYIVVENEHEALVLERNLIGQYHPYFNVDYKDDKSYPYIAITKDDVFPAIKYTRERHRKGTRYFGPYTDSRAARETIDTLRKVQPICLATCAEPHRCASRRRKRHRAHLRAERASVLRLSRGQRSGCLRGSHQSRRVRSSRTRCRAFFVRTSRCVCSGA